MGAIPHHMLKLSSVRLAGLFEVNQRGEAISFI